MSDAADNAPEAQADKSTFCYAKHAGGLEPGQPGYCAGSCNQVVAHGDTGHICNACGQPF